MQQFAKRLYQLMDEKGVSQSALGNAVGVTRQSIAQYLDGNTQPNAEKLCAIADFFNVSADYLLGRTDCRSSDVDIQEICKKTGLSNNTIEMLIELKENDTLHSGDKSEDEEWEWIPNWTERKESFFKFLSALLDWSTFENLFDLSESIYKRIDASNKEDLLISSFQDVMELIPDEYKDYYLFPYEYETFKELEAQSYLRRICEHLYKFLKYGPDLPFDSSYLSTRELEEAIRRAKRNAET